jgi:hypothetical protein
VDQHAAGVLWAASSAVAAVSVVSARREEAAACDGPDTEGGVPEQLSPRNGQLAARTLVHVKDSL